MKRAKGSSRRLWPALLVVLVATVSGVAPAAAAAPAPVTTTTPPPPPPKAWILVDADTGNIVDAGNARARLPPASLTKVITALAASNLAPDTPVTVSDRAASAPADKLFMKPGQVWTADQMLHALLISSANDAAVALAEQSARQSKASSLSWHGSRRAWEWPTARSSMTRPDWTALTASRVATT